MTKANAKNFRTILEGTDNCGIHEKSAENPAFYLGGRPKRTSKGGEEDATIIEICGKGKSKSVI